MSESIRKALRILEYLSEEPMEPKLLPEIAKSLGIPPASCARMLNALVRERYVEKRGKRGGFLLGPMPYVLTSKGPYMKDVAETAWPEVQLCADTVKEYVVLAARHMGRCYKIVEFDGNPEIRIRSKFVMGGLYGTATGRLLLAFAGDDEIGNCIKANGLPGNEWPECKTQKKLKDEIDKIRKEKFSVSRTRTLVAFAYPVKYGGREVLGLGCSMPLNSFRGGNREAVLSCVKKTAETIEKKLVERRD